MFFGAFDPQSLELGIDILSAWLIIRAIFSIFLIIVACWGLFFSSCLLVSVVTSPKCSKVKVSQ